MALFVNFLQVQLEFGKLVFVKEGGGGTGLPGVKPTER